MKIIEQTDSGTCTKTIKVEVPRDQVDTQMAGVYQEFMQHATVPGFRKGKAPKSVVQMRYGRILQDEAVGKAIEKAFQDATKELDLHPVTTPNVLNVEKDKQDEPIVFEAQFEYRPQITPGDYQSIQIEKPTEEVTEKEVVETLNRLREQNAMYATVEDRGASESDFLTIASTATIDGEPFTEASHNEITVEMGSNRYIPGFVDQLKGMKAGEEKTFTLPLPDDYPIEDKRGKTAEFTVTVKQVQEKRLPELDDEFAKDMGNYEDLNDLKERIRKDLEHNLEHRREHQIEDSIRKTLLDMHTFDAPPSMVKARYNYINAMQEMEYQRYGYSLQAAAQQDEGLMARNEKAAEEEVRLSLILDAIAQDAQIVVSDDEYTNYIAKMARQDNADPKHYMTRIESQGLDTYYRRVALEEKVMNYLKTLVDTD